MNSGVKSSMASNNIENPGRAIFQQEWWLDLVTDGRYGEVVVKNGGKTVGWLPYVTRRRWGFDVSDMPYLTHTLGPIIYPGTGRANTQLLNRFAITTALLAKLPKLAQFRQVLAPTDSEALAFQAYGCHVRVQFTFIAECANIDDEWRNMRDKTRNLIRRAREKNSVSAGGDPERFLRFYDANCVAGGAINRYKHPRTEKILSRCLERDQGRIILSTSRKTGVINAGIFVIWDDSTMHFLMSTRSQETADSGAVSLLIWEAMNDAHRRGLKFDFDGVSNAGSFRFFSGFGGNIARRLVVEKFNALYHSMDKIRALIYGNAHQPFE